MDEGQNSGNHGNKIDGRGGQTKGGRSEGTLKNPSVENDVTRWRVARD